MASTVNAAMPRKVALPNRNIVISCGGKWTGLLSQLRVAVSNSSDFSGAKILVADQDRFAPSAVFADQWIPVPSIASEQYCASLLTACTKNAVGLVVPLIDLDVNRLSPFVQQFSDHGIHLLCPSETIAYTCFDKNEFHAFCHRHRLSSPTRYGSVKEALQARFPLFAKPLRGYGSCGLHVLREPDELGNREELFKTHIVQDFVLAPELSVDAYINQVGDCILRVPRARVQVIGGEVYKSETVDLDGTVELADRTIAALAMEGLRGPVNVQLFGGPNPCLIEVNPRLGSGNVLSNMATGGRFYDAILLESAGKVATGDKDAYLRNLTLRRFHGDLFHLPDKILTQSTTVVGMECRP